jgi:predicted extracellular nuclease
MSVTLANVTFSAFAGGGFAPSPAAGQLDSDLWSVAVSAANSLAFGGTATSGFLARGTTGAAVTTGGLYALNRGAGDVALLIQPSVSDFTTSATNFLFLRLQHTGPSPLGQLTFDYEGLFRNDQARDTRVGFAYAVSSSAALPAGFTAVGALSFDTPGAATGGGLVSVALDATTVSATVNTGDYVFLRWNIGDIGGSGARDEIGFDNILVTGAAAAAPAPTIGITATALSRTEGNSGLTPFAFTVARSALGPGDATVPVTLSGGPGFDAADFASITVGGVAVGGAAIGVPFDVTLAGAALSVEVVVNVVGDTVVEEDELFTLALGTPSAGFATSGGSASSLVINDDAAAPALTAIAAVQGPGAASPLVGQTVTIEGVVTGDYQNGDADTTRNIQGFFVQSVTPDGLPNTSDGVFVFQGPTLGTDVRLGDIVRVTGTVVEFNGETQISTTPATGISVVTAGAYTAAQVEATFALDVSLPAAGTLVAGGRVIPDLEFAEGMLIRLPQALTVTELFNLDRFGEFRVAQGPQATQFTQTNLPDVAGYSAYLQELGARSLLVDDGLNVQNPNPITFLGASVTTATAVQIGDTISAGLVGNLGFGFNEYRLRPSNSPEIVDTAPRLPAPGRDGGELKLASANLLNYFVTLDNNSNLTGPPGNQQEPRGANTAAEFARQEQKLLTALFELDADVVVLNEVENNGFGAGSAIQRLADQLDAKYDANGRAAADWTFVDPGTPFLGGDAISVGILYRADKVALAAGSSVAVLDDSDIPALTTAGLLPADFLARSTKGAVFNGPDTSRAVLVASLQELGTGEVFTLAAVHNKSKSGIGTGADANLGDGAGNWNNQRLLATQALDAFLQANPTGIADPDQILLGDFNSYAKEISIRHLTEAAGFNNLIEQRLGPDAFSFVFDGQKGYLDYAFASDSVLSAVRGVHEWHANSPEPDAIDYNLDFGRPASIFDGTVSWRYSDHDPVVVNLLFDPGLMIVRGGADIVGSRSFADATSLARAGDTVQVRDAARITDGADARLAADDLTVALGATEGFVFSFGTAPPTVDSVTFTGNGGFRFEGDARAETVRGNAGANTLSGGAGNDSLLGGEGNDVIDGGDGSDLLDGGAGVDTVSFASAALGVRANLGLADPQRTVGPDFDTLLGFENLIGSAFGDTLVGDAGANVIRGGDGDDRISGQGGADLLDGGAGNDDVRGGAGGQEIRGGDGNDFLFGGAGADRFVFDLADGSDRIGDFRRAEGDKIVLQGGGAADLVFAGSSFTFGQTEVRLLNAPPLLASDFLFA